MSDTYQRRWGNPVSQVEGGPSFENAAAVTPDNSTDLTTPARALWVGSVGDVKVNMCSSGQPVTFTNVPSGTLLPVAVTRVFATGTSASNIVALW